jgi:signal transduction histidine kinase
MLEFREDELEQEVARRRLVEEELVEHQDHLEKLVAQRTLELQRTNEELVISKEKAEEMNLLKSHFLNNMGHEIRTPINGILGIAQVLEFETDIDEIQTYSAILKESGERLYRTLTGILNLSKLESERTEIEREAMDILPIIQEEIECQLAKANEKDLELNFEASDLPKVAFIEEEMFRQVVFFLLENAIKFTNSGGVTVSCRNEDPGTGTGRVCVQITDTGIGMDQTFMDKLFDPFSQESSGQGRAYEGTGLGLTLVQKFTHLLGGEIRVESEKGVGTTFEILLPERALEPVSL